MNLPADKGLMRHRRRAKICTYAILINGELELTQREPHISAWADVQQRLQCQVLVNQGAAVTLPTLIDNRWSINQFLSSSTSSVIGRSKTAVRSLSPVFWMVRMNTFLTSPSELGMTSSITAVGQLYRLEDFSFTRTKSPAFKFSCLWSHFLRLCNSNRYSLLNLLQNCSAR